MAAYRANILTFIHDIKYFPVNRAAAEMQSTHSTA